MLVRLVSIALLALVSGCHRDYGKYELDERTFDAEAIEKIEVETGIDLPTGVKGLRFLHLPPVDPIVFAKIGIPSGLEAETRSQLAALKQDEARVKPGFANDSCAWWRPDVENAELSRLAFRNGFYIEAYLVREAQGAVLYLKYYTI